MTFAANARCRWSRPDYGGLALTRSGRRYGPALRFLEFSTPIFAAAWLSATPALAGSLPTFDTSTEMVELDVAVSDGAGRHVPGLSSKDLEVYEDGVAQQLEFFSWEPLPLSLALLVDTSDSMRQRFELVRKAAGGFVSALRPEDRAQLRRFNLSASIVQDYTTDSQLLRRALENLQPEGNTSLYNALYITLSEQRSEPADQRRRRVIVLLTDGLDTTSRVTEDQVLQLARSSDVSIHSIGILGPPGETLTDRAHYFLSALSSDTGGQAYFPTAASELDGVYASIADDLRARYCVGYVPTRSARNSWRHISVLTPKREGLRLRHRTGYYPANTR